MCIRDRLIIIILVIIITENLSAQFFKEKLADFLNRLLLKKQIISESNIITVFNGCVIINVVVAVITAAIYFRIDDSFRKQHYLNISKH